MRLKFSRRQISRAPAPSIRRHPASSHRCARAIFWSLNGHCVKNVSIKTGTMQRCDTSGDANKLPPAYGSPAAVESFRIMQDVFKERGD